MRPNTDAFHSARYRLEVLRRAAYAELTTHSQPSSALPLLQNFEAQRTLKTVGILQHALALASDVDNQLPLSRRETVLALLEKVRALPRPDKRYDVAVIEDIASILPIVAPQGEKKGTQGEDQTEEDRLWISALSVMTDPSLRATLALAGGFPASYCALHTYLWNVLEAEEREGATDEARLRAYACLLAIRDGIAWNDRHVSDAISAVPGDIITLEYFVVRVTRPEGLNGPLVYIGVSCNGGRTDTLSFKYCLSDRQENDREISDMRGHYTGENGVEARARKLARVVNTSISFGDQEIDFVATKTRRVASSIIRGLINLTDVVCRLAIRPIGDLHRVPFEALPIADGKALGDHLAIHYLPKPAVLSRFSSHPCMLKGVPLVVGGCNFDDGGGDGRLVQLRSRFGLFENLPGTVVEATRVCDMIRGKLISGEAADRTAIVGALNTPRPIVHFATHSFFVDRERHHAQEVHGDVIKTIDPKFAGCTYSSILLSGANDHIGRDGSIWLNDRGLLDTSAILGLDMSKTLVVTLSSCESGIGAIELGAELDSMREAFLAAGARVVIASLWPVNDSDTTIFMEEFYRHLVAGARISIALKNARNELGNLPFRSRYAFVAFGEDIYLEGFHGRN